MRPFIGKITKWFSIFFGASLVFIVLGTLLLIYFVTEPSREEVLRLHSPSGKTDAVVIEVNGGATTAFAYEVRLEESGGTKKSTKVAYFYAPWRNVKGASGLDLKWISADELHIEFFASRTEELLKPVVKLSNETVRVLLKPGVDNQTAPFSMRASG